MTAPTPHPGRNEPCHCGSGKKYKHCCLDKDNAEASAKRAKEAAAADAAAQSSAAPAQPVSRTPKHQTEQPWKHTSRGFVPRTRSPRKVGGS